MIESLLIAIRDHLFGVTVFFLFIYLAANYFNHGLNKYPGPFLAAITNWWRFFDVYGRRPDITHIKLHRQHGDIVRLGPNALSFSNPQAIKQIYGLNKGFIKSGFFPVQQATARGRRLPSLFSTTDEAYHANLRRSINSAFSMSALVQYEPLVNETVETFLNQTSRLFVKTNKICDFAEWLQFLAFDVIGQITYSKRHGFVDRGEDVDGMVAYLGKLFSYVAPIGQMPVLDLFLLKNPILLFLDWCGVGTFSFAVATFAKARMSERLVEMEENKAKGIEEFSDRRGDLLSMFLKAKEERPEFMTDQRVLTMAVSMAFAGSETTAISLAAVFYFLLKHPDCYRKLMHELEEAVQSGEVEPRSDCLVSWAESQNLPYLDAVIKESFRLHPAAGLPLERIVPPSGMEICGEVIPGGTIVGVSAWVVHRRQEIYGDNIDSYRPERWLEADKDRLKEMNGTLFQFGAGSRTCIGKNISLLEIYKLVPSFLRRFEIELANPNQEWRLHNAWFVKQHNFFVRFRERSPTLA